MSWLSPHFFGKVSAHSAVTTLAPQHASRTTDLAAIEWIAQAIERATHWLPAQGPISVFVHHNTLHALEDLPFEQAVVKGGELYQCEPYWSEARYHAELARGRICTEEVRSILLEDLDDNADGLISALGTRHALRLAMLQYPLPTATEAELEWLIAETSARDRFRPEVDAAARRRMVASTAAWLNRFQIKPSSAEFAGQREKVSEWMGGNVPSSTESWSERQWESFTLHFLWRVCLAGVQQVPAVQKRHNDPHYTTHRLRHQCIAATGRDSDQMVDEVMIRFCASYLDQGFAGWPLPHRDLGFFEAFIRLYSLPATPVPTWLKGLRSELQALTEKGISPLRSIADSLQQMGVAAQDGDVFVLHSLLALRGWAGLIWQMESNAPWTPHPAPLGSLVGYLAIRLILERAALTSIARQEFQVWTGGSQSGKANRPKAKNDPARLFEHFRDHLKARPQNDLKTSTVASAFVVFQLAQVRGWGPQELVNLSALEWQQLLLEIAGFPQSTRRRLLHMAYERTYYRAALDALLSHSRRCKSPAVGSSDALPKSPPAYQVVCCIDDREESFRRHLEECDPEVETYGAPGFFAVAMYYQGASEAHYRPLCPVVVTPQHFVREEPVFTAIDLSRKRTERRRLIGHFAHQVHLGSRTLFGGIVTGVLGTLATFPLIARILAPRLTSQVRGVLGGLVSPPATELHIERVAELPGPAVDQLGYSVVEMAAIVRRVFEDIGLAKGFAPLVLFVGHGSSSLNNPHASAYNCGACSGGRGGPNARSFALMANDRRVRALLAQSAIVIPDAVWVLGAYHNTCNDFVEYYDLDHLPRAHRDLFRRIEQSFNKARSRNAHERARRFESAPTNLSHEETLQHVEERSEDLSQARPEYNHATNALCLVGRRRWSRGLFLDRRAFLTSYDPTLDDDRASTLERILAAAIPVCAGINLEYFFSTVDSEGYGCGSKLPHNISGLAGVMSGAASDIRPGLSSQMVEIHEPMRMLFVIETTPANMLGIMSRQPVLDRLIRNKWVHLSLFDSDLGRVMQFTEGSFEAYQPGLIEIPQVNQSLEWYGGRRDHLGFASIVAERVDNDQLEAIEPRSAP